MNPIKAVFRLSLAVLLRSRRTYIVGALCMVAVVFSMVGSVLVSGGLASRDMTGFSILSYIIVNGYVHFLLLVVCLFYGTALIHDEVEDKTITYLFMRPVSKSTVYLGKYLAYLVATSLLILPTATLCFLIAMASDPAGEAARHFPILLQDLSVLGLGILAYGAMFALMGTVLKRPVFVGLGFAIVWETLVTFIPGYLSKLTIKHYLLALLPHPVGQRGVLGFFESTTGPITAVTALLVITVALVALGSYLFTNKEYVLEQ